MRVWSGVSCNESERRSRKTNTRAGGLQLFSCELHISKTAVSMKRSLHGARGRLKLGSTSEFWRSAPLCESGADKDIGSTTEGLYCIITRERGSFLYRARREEE